MVKKDTHRGTARETARNSVKDGGAVEPDTSRRARESRRQPPNGVGTRWRQSPSLTPRRSPSLRARQSPSAIALFLSKKGNGKHVRREAAGLPRAPRVPNATSRCNTLGSVVLTLGELRRITKDFSDDQLIGEGAFGKVYKGVLTNGDMIAVKRFASTITGLQDGQYENEAEHLMRLEHPNIVQLVGYCSETETKLVRLNGKFVRAEQSERLLCLEYMPKGSLRGHLSDESSGLDWKTRYKIIKGICYGLHYLHEEWQVTPIIHMDLKPANILLDDNMVPKIADFGLSRLFGEEQTRTCTTSCKGTPGYMAPEYLEKGVITKKFDIFSLGVIIIEIITGLKGYPTEETETTSQQYIDMVLNNWTRRSQDIDYQQINKCIQIGLLCVKFDGAKRPTIDQIIKMLERSGEAYKNEREMPEEAAKALTTSFLSRAPSLCRTLADQNQPPRYKLSFVNSLETEVFMNKVICDIDGEPLTIRVIANDQDGIDAHILNAKIEVVVLHGDFNRHNQECWTREEFSNSIVRPEDEFRVILTGTLQLSLTNGEAELRGATFTGSSRFVRNVRFRLGVMVSDDLSERVQEGITKPFVVQEAAAAVENRFGDKLARPVDRPTPSSSLSSAARTTSGSDGDTESDAETHRREKLRLSNREGRRRRRRRKQQHLEELTSPSSAGGGSSSRGTFDTAEDASSRAFSCTYCDKKFYSFQALGAHRSTHKAKRAHELAAARRAGQGGECATAAEAEEPRMGREMGIAWSMSAPSSSSSHQIRASPEASRNNLTDDIDLSLKL